MKKNLFFCGLALAAAGTVMAATDQINLHNGGVVANSIKVDDVETINYFKAEGSASYTHFTVKYLNGLSSDFAIDDFSAIKYEQASMVNPLSVEVIPHHYGIEVEVSTEDPDAWYRFSGVPESLLKDLDPEEWAMALFEMDAAFIEDVAEQYGQPLSSFKMSEIFQQGPVRREWFPDQIISDDTPIAFIYYTADIKNDQVVLTSTPRLLRFNTKKLEDIGIEFDIQAELTSTKVNLTVTPKEHENLTDDFTYYVTLYSEADVAASSLPTLLSTDLYHMQQMVYLYGMPWDQFLSNGTSTHQYTNRRMGDKWLAVACGVEMGVGVTKPTIVELTIPEAEVTDDCQFTVTSTEVSKSEFMLNVTPSNPDTRWVGFLVETESLKAKGAAYHLANRIYNINWMHTYDWTTTEFVHSGEASVSSHDGLIDGSVLKAGVEYTALIIGIEDDGTRTTEIQEVPLKCEATVTKDLTFDFTFGDITGTGDWTRNLSIRVKPSDKKEQYVIAYLPATHYTVRDENTDEEVIRDYVDVQGSLLETYKGNQTKVMAMGSEFVYTGDTEGEWKFKPYRFFVFGYDGAQTSELYMFEIDPEADTITQIRGPKPTEEE